jgi:hypothetical protein
MRIVSILLGSLSLGVGVLLCIPVGFLAWHSALFSAGTVHEHFILSFGTGSMALTDWQMWASAGGLALVGVLLAIVGLYLFSQKDESC